MPDLTVALLRGPDPAHAPEILDEINRRWALAGRQQGLAMHSVLAEMTRAAEPPPSSPDDLAAVEDARQFLATQTLVHELWVLQEADVTPADLYASVDTIRRVHRILNRELARADPAFGPDGEIVHEPDELDDAATHLAHWSRIALFGRGDQLIADQLRLAGAMDQDLTQSRYLLTQDALAELHGPWSLEEHLANPVGKQYLRRSHPGPKLSCSPAWRWRLDARTGRSPPPNSPRHARTSTPRCGPNATASPATIPRPRSAGSTPPTRIRPIAGACWRKPKTWRTSSAPRWSWRHWPPTAWSESTAAQCYARTCPGSSTSTKTASTNSPDMPE